MEYKMPDLTKIGGNNKLEVPPIKIELKSKENLLNIAEKIIRKMIEISPWQRWPFKNPKNKFLLPEKINQLARDLIEEGKICLKSACLSLTMKNGRISLNVTYWLHWGNDGNPPRPVGHIQYYLEPIMKDTATEALKDWEEMNKAATPEETRQIIDQLALEARKKIIELPEEVISKKIPEMDFQPTSGTISQEVQEIIHRLTMENWQPKNT